MFFLHHIFILTLLTHDGFKKFYIYIFLNYFWVLIRSRRDSVLSSVGSYYCWLLNWPLFQFKHPYIWMSIAVFLHCVKTFRFLYWHIHSLYTNWEITRRQQHFFFHLKIPNPVSQTRLVFPVIVTIVNLELHLKITVDTWFLFPTCLWFCHNVPVIIYE